MLVIGLENTAPRTPDIHVMVGEYKLREEAILEE
jgi:hypothetical protein